MKVAVFDTHRFEQDTFRAVNERFGHDLTYFEPRLTGYAAPLAAG